MLSPLKLDYPFEKYILFQNQIEQSGQDIVRKMMGKDTGLRLNFLLKYTLDNEATNRLIFLFYTRIGDESLIKKKGRLNGKFWSMKQIEDTFGDEIFSECFELEYEYLKNTVLIENTKTTIEE